jgi:copper transport protein
VVSYRVIPSDGHPVAGGFPFSIIAPSLVDRAVPTGEGFRAPARWYVLTLVASGRYLGYAGIVLLCGALVTAAAFRRRPQPVAALRRWTRWGWALLAGGTLTSLAVQIPYSTGGGFTDVTGAHIVSTASTTVTQAHLARLAVLVAALPLLRAVLTPRPLRRAERVTATLLAVALFLTWPLSGHTGTGSWWWLTMPLDALHIAAVSVWIGGLVVLVRSILPAAGSIRPAAILPLWSRWATWAVIVLVGSGLAEAAVLVRSPQALFETAYGRLLLGKATGPARRAIRRRHAPATTAGGTVRPCVSPTGTGSDTIELKPAGQGTTPMLTAASIATVRIAPDLTDETQLTRVVRRSALLEIALSTVVIGLATALVQAPPGYSARPGRVPAVESTSLLGGPFYSIDRTPTVTLQVDLDPAQVGSNTMLLTTLDPAGRPLAARDWSVKASLPTANLRNVQVPVREMATGVAYAFPQLPKPGDWTFVIAVSTGETEQTVVMHTVRVY